MKSKEKLGSICIKRMNFFGETKIVEFINTGETCLVKISGKSEVKLKVEVFEKIAARFNDLDVMNIKSERNHGLFLDGVQYQVNITLNDKHNSFTLFGAHASKNENIRELERVLDYLLHLGNVQLFLAKFSLIDLLKNMP